MCTRQEVVAATKLGEMGTMVTQTHWRTLATFGQYLLPLMCVAGAGILAWHRQARRKLIADVGQRKAADALDGMSWREFENMLVGEAFRLQGYGILETGGGGADGGVDLVLSKGTEKYLCSMQAVEGFQGRCGRGARTLRRHGGQGRSRRLGSDLGAVHRRCSWLRQRAQSETH